MHYCNYFFLQKQVLLIVFSDKIHIHIGPDWFGAKMSLSELGQACCVPHHFVWLTI
jgi:hypothetical protein